MHSNIEQNTNKYGKQHKDYRKDNKRRRGIGKDYSINIKDIEYSRSMENNLDKKFDLGN